MSKPVPLERGKYYHIYNRGNNRENVFIEERNYAYFLKLYARHIAPVADTYAYCLLRNHFHLLVRINENPKGLQDPLGLASKSPSQTFGDFFNAYAKAINKAYGRTGSLFQHPFGRIEVTTDLYLARLVVYIHQNPQKHGFVTDWRDWPFSSYHTLLAAGPTRLKRDDVLAWFGGAHNLAAAHQQESVDYELAALTPEDFD